MIAAQKYPELFPDKDAERIVRELGIDLSGNALYRLQYMWMNCLIRQYDLASEVEGYLAGHPSATVVEMGAGLSCLRRQMGNETNPWYCLDMENVIELREKHVPKGIREHNVVCDLNDFSWFDEIDFNPARGIVFVQVASSTISRSAGAASYHGMASRSGAYRLRCRKPARP